MRNVFERFYTEPVEIVKITESGGYQKQRTETPLTSLMVNMQPYRGLQPFGAAIKETDYGQRLDYQLKMYCDSCPDVTEGNFVRYSNRLYKIVYAGKWMLGDAALLKEVDDLV